jgi:uncharacterized protein YgbK (DUF1537 family)
VADRDLLVAYYGDDFTGSTDVLESLTINGVDTALFLDTPSPDDIDDLDVQAVGVTGTSRSMSPSEMDEELPPAFEGLSAFDPEIILYKVCSTFDSTPEVGSIGHAIDLGQTVIDSPFVPVVVAAPSLVPRGRYVLFGNLFATVGGTTHRLDRHPTMRNHPVTPMTEADLRRHLGRQTDKEIGLLDIRALDGKQGAELTASLEEVIEEGTEIVFFDGLNDDHQRKVGTLIWEQARSTDGPLFTASSAGVTYALTAHLQDAGIVETPPEPTPIDAVDQLVVISGSASPVTAAQIDWALDNGFEGVRLDTVALVDPQEAPGAREKAVDAALEAIADGESVVLYSALGPDDPAIEKTIQRSEELGAGAVPDRLGTEQGQITRRIIDESRLSRLCVSGGDTSGYVAPELDIYALEFAAPVAPGSPLCRGQSRKTAFDGLEVVLKGGQVETETAQADIFEAVRRGGRPY